MRFHISISSRLLQFLGSFDTIYFLHTTVLDCFFKGIADQLLLVEGLLQALHHGLFLFLRFLHPFLMVITNGQILKSDFIISFFVSIKPFHFISLIHIHQPALITFLSFKRLLISHNILVMNLILLVKATFPLCSYILICLLVRF